MKIYVSIHDDNDGPANGILLAQVERQAGMSLAWALANRISWVLRHLGLRDDNAEEWLA